MTPSPAPHASATTRGVGSSPNTSFVECDGFRWCVQTIGKGPTALLLHGTGSSHQSFHRLAEQLGSDFTVIAPDLPGHASTRSPHAFVPTLPGIAAALSKLLDHLKASPVLVVGHSAGAAILARMIISGFIHPQLFVGLSAAIIPLRGWSAKLFPPTARFLSNASTLVPLRIRNAETVARVLRGTGSFSDEASLEHYRSLSARPSHVAGTLAMLASWDLTPLLHDLALLRTPTLLIAADRDRAVPLEQQRELATRVPHARLVVLHDAGHLLHEEKPDAVTALIVDEFHARTNRNKENTHD